MHPNPSTGEIVFDFEGGIKMDLKLYNSHGLLVYLNQIGSGEGQDISMLSSGFYYAELGDKVFKLVKL